jgi:hypothetical protein
MPIAIPASAMSELSRNTSRRTPRRGSAERDPDSELPSPARCGVGHHSVESDTYARTVAINAKLIDRIIRRRSCDTTMSTCSSTV